MIIGCAYFLSVDLLKELSWNILLHCALYTALACNRKADPQNKYNKNIVAFFFFFVCLFCFSPLPSQMDLPAVQLLCLEQQDRSLEDHTVDFLDLVCLMPNSDCSLCIFYLTSLSKQSKAHLPANGPIKDFAMFVEWVLMNSPTPGPESSQPSSRHQRPPQMGSQSPPRLMSHCKTEQHS